MSAKKTKKPAVTLSIRFGAELHEAATLAAEADGRTIAQWVRMCIMRELEKIVEVKK